MKIRVNERETEVPAGTTIAEVRLMVKPRADVLIQNGFPVPETTILQEGDELVLIVRGERPSVEELEALLVARHTPGVHQKIREGCVGIAGLGGLGSAVAVALTRTGVGKLVLADYDVVEPSNLNRQQFFLGQIGRNKTEALQENLSRINPFVMVSVHPLELMPENIAKVFSGVDVVVEAFDRAEAKMMLIKAVMEGLPGKPVVAASGLAGYGPANAIVTRKLARNLYVVGDEVSEAKPGVGLMAPRVGVAAHHQASAAIRLLLGEDPVG